jgi:hypothetical protein
LGAAEEAAMGYFTTLDPRMQEAIIEVARKDRVKAIAQAKIDMQEQLAYKQFRRQENLDKLLKATIERYANGLELFTAWRAHGVRDWGAAGAKLLAAGSEAEKLLFLRNEIEMRLIGLGWTQFETRWSSSSDETVGTVDNLSGLLKDILAHETAERRLNNLPKEAAPPPLRMRTLKDLGTPSIDPSIATLRSTPRSSLDGCALPPNTPFIPARAYQSSLPHPIRRRSSTPTSLRRRPRRSGDGVWRPAFLTTLRTSSRSARPPSPRSSTRRSRSAGRTSTATPASASLSGARAR